MAKMNIVALSVKGKEYIIKDMMATRLTKKQFEYVQQHTDGRRLKLKQNTEWAYKVQKTQVQCVSAERLFEFLTREDEFWHSTVDKILKDIAERRVS